MRARETRALVARSRRLRADYMASIERSCGRLTRQRRSWLELLETRDLYEIAMLCLTSATLALARLHMNRTNRKKTRK